MGGTKQQAGGKRAGRARRVLRRLAAVAVAAGGLAVVVPTTQAGAVPLPEYLHHIDECGVQPLKTARGGTAQYWDCTLAENFDGTTLNPALWNVQTTASSGFGQGGECFVNDPDNVSVSGGNLRLTVRKEAKPFTCTKPKPGSPGQTISFDTMYTAGSVLTYSKFSQAYGRFEIRAAMPAVTVPGLQFAYWLWPQDVLKYGNQWPMSGELDVMEWYSKNPQLGIPTMHYAGDWADPNRTNFNCVVGDMSQFHTYTIEWNPTVIKILYDGQVCLTNSNWTPTNGITKPAPFDHPFMVSLTQALGYYNPSATAEQNSNKVTPQTPLPATARIDYLKVWE